MDNYDLIHKQYVKTNEKPDKKYSMLPTILKIAEPLKNKIVVDLGCGEGFFTFPLAEKAKFVYGIDNSIEQIKRARKKQKNTNFILGDMFEVNYPKSDLIIIPFILNTVDTKEKILRLFKKFYSSLNTKGKVVGLIDSPKSLVSDNRNYGAVKIVKSDFLSDGASLEINLFRKNSFLLTLHVVYYTKETVEECLNVAGFKNIKWCRPIISKEGIEKYGKSFWKEYLEKCDVAYFTAEKSD